MDCEVASQRLVPLSKVVRAALLDTYSDIGRWEAMYTHWAAREFKKINRETLKGGKRGVYIPVNGNTNTATLPEDYEDYLFVGYVNDKGVKVPIRINTGLVAENSIDTIECVDKCEKCQQDSGICNDLQVTETVELIVIGGSTYEKTIIKKLYPNGDYFLETTTPILDIDANTVSYFTEKQFINNLDLKACGCLETTPENLTKLRQCRPDIYCCYYSSCESTCSTDHGSFMILEDVGLIQFSPNFRLDHCYMEYLGFLPKKNGQYQIPEVSFETVVAGTKYRAVKNKPNIPLSERNWYLQDYKSTRGNMIKVMGRITLDSIIQAATRIPKFDIFVDPWRECFRRTSEVTASDYTAPAETCDTVTAGTCSTGTTVIYLYKDILYGKKQFIVGASGALMTAGQTQLVINESNIFTDSLNVVLDGAVLQEGMTGVISYSVVYEASKITITVLNPDPADPSINYGVMDGQKYTFTFSKTVTT